MSTSAFCFLARKQIEKRVSEEGIRNFYIPSFSHRLIVYKGLLFSPSLEIFTGIFAGPSTKPALCVFHQRYSTNTFPTWPLSQPFRMLGHNGEINTLRGNRSWMQAREAELQADFWGARHWIAASDHPARADPIPPAWTTPWKRWSCPAAGSCMR